VVAIHRCSYASDCRRGSFDLGRRQHRRGDRVGPGFAPVVFRGTLLRGERLRLLTRLGRRMFGKAPRSMPGSQALIEIEGRLWWARRATPTAIAHPLGMSPLRGVRHVASSEIVATSPYSWRSIGQSSGTGAGNRSRANGRQGWRDLSVRLACRDVQSPARRLRLVRGFWRGAASARSNSSSNDHCSILHWPKRSSAKFEGATVSSHCSVPPS
jgi:hypothetical protein